MSKRYILQFCQSQFHQMSQICDNSPLKVIASLYKRSGEEGKIKPSGSVYALVKSSCMLFPVSHGSSMLPMIHNHVSMQFL